MRHTYAWTALLILAGCGGDPSPPVAAKEPPTTPPADSMPVAPAIISPADVAGSNDTPSYEVAIATAAAEHNAAKRRCATQPEAVRTQCEQEANAAFGDAEQDLEDLRGNQQ